MGIQDAALGAMALFAIIGGISGSKLVIWLLIDPIADTCNALWGRPFPQGEKVHAFNVGRAPRIFGEGSDHGE